MNRIFWLFVVLVVVTPLSEARHQNCPQKERILAGLHLAESSLKRARDLYPDCGGENVGQKNKSLGFVDTALNLLSETKKNLPDCLDIKPMDCQDLQAAGAKKSGVYTVLLGGRPVRVRCDMETDGGGWTVIQRRGNFSLQEDFYRDWQDYKHGFGNLTRDFWIGNEIIHSLSNQGNYSLRIDMAAADGESAYEVFQIFRIGDENSNYKLHVEKSSGTAGDSLRSHNGMMFSTKDKNNDILNDLNCAEFMKSCFWFHYCASCNPNGRYKPGAHDSSAIFYNTFKGQVGLSAFEMKMKRI